MKQKIPNGVVIAAIVILIAGVAYFGYRVVTGVNGPDMTQENIKRYQAAREHTFSSPQEAAKAGAPMGSAPMGANPGGAAGGSH